MEPQVQLQQGIQEGQKQTKVKTKVRFTSLDTAAVIAELQALVGLRVSNIYDVSPTTYLLKFTKAEQKYHLLIQNGVRFHTTQQAPDKKRLPSGFTMKFRKYLRSKRLESIKQVGVERVVVLTFGSQSFTNHLILQLYSQGNIILTDNNYRILQCIRSHQFNDKVKTAVGEVYPFQLAANIYLQNIQISKEALEKLLARNQTSQTEADSTKKKGKAQSKGQPKVKDIVFQMIPCLFPQVIEHILETHKIDADLKIQDEVSRQTALNAAQRCMSFLTSFLSTKQKGYLYIKGEQYFQFSPFPNCKLQTHPQKEFNSFDSAVGEYFAKYKRSAHEQEEAFEELAWKKYEQIRKDQEERVSRLIQEQESFGGKAQLIEKNIEDVEAVLKIISTMEGNGYSWQAMDRMVAESRKSGDPLANMIHLLNPTKRQITVLLSDLGADEPDLCPLTPVQLLVDFNAYTNATMYYQSRKKQQQKEARTREASEQVLKLAEKDALKKIQKKKNELLIKAVPTRKTMWFEKFYWFITSDGWLVISGRDSHQNQVLVKRYMKPGDLYMHSDYGGAASTIIKGPPKSGVPPLTSLEEAAAFTVCRSKAWDTKIISSAWWVYHDQVSKSAPTGEYLPTGSFMIRGKRNFLHPNRMEMGFTLLYRLDNESLQRKLQLKAKLTGDIQEQTIQPQSLEREASSRIEEEEYAIIDLEAQARQVREKKKQKHVKSEKQDQNKGKLIEQPKSSAKQREVQEEEQEQSSQEENVDRGKKKESQKQAAKKEVSKIQDETGIGKHKNRNKKKLKKLEKYMEEQDQDERKIIMKMLGAKEMKHLQEDEEEAERQEKPKNKKQQQIKKKGIQKYLERKEDPEDNAIDKNKVLFLKQSKDNKDNIESESKKQVETSSQQLKKTQQEQEVVVLKEEPKLGPNNLEEKVPEKESTSQAVQAKENNEVTGQQKEKKEENEHQESSSEGEEEAQKEQGKQKQQQEEVDQKIIDSELSELPRLVGRVSFQDNWDALIPMCAPYSTIKDCNFKVKLLPGALKKGKAARSIQSYLLTGELQQNEKAYIRAVPEQQLINALIGNVKLGGAGLLKLQQKAKQEKKEKRKEQQRKDKNQ